MVLATAYVACYRLYDRLRIRFALLSISYGP